MSNTEWKALIGIGFAAIIIITLANAKADGRNVSENTIRNCSSNIAKPTIVTDVTTLSKASASVAFRMFYKGSAPKVSVFEHNGKKGYYARSVQMDMRSGVTRLARCYFATKNGKVRN